MRSRSGTKPSHTPGSALKAVDSCFSIAGLVRSRRGKPAESARTPRFQRAETEDLGHPAPVPARSPNGVEWLPIPGWDDSWLWSGFSTRKGGLSRAYCADDAPGELNLGFTAADDRETVLRNRRLLAEAVTGDAATPIVALRQFHSNLVVQATPIRRCPRSAPAGPTGK